MKFGKVISLGGSCQVAHQIRRTFPTQTESYVFDWLGTYPERSVADAIEAGISEIARLENLKIREEGLNNGKYWKVQDDRFDISLIHHFPAEHSLEEGYVRFRSKMDYLSERWVRLMERGVPVLFVRLGSHPTGANATSPAHLEAALARAYPRLDFSILYLSQQSEWTRAKEMSQRIIPGFMPRSESWSGDDRAWSDLLHSVTGTAKFPARA